MKNHKCNCKGFLTQMKARNYTRATIETFGGSLKFFLAYLKKQKIGRLQDVTVDDIEKYQGTLMERKLSPNTAIVYVKAVKHFFTYLEKESVVFVNPCENVQYPKADGRIQPIPTEDEMRRLIEAVDVSRTVGVRDRAMIETMYSCGLRLEELLNLTVHAIDFKENTIRVLGKGRKERILPLTTQASEWLGKYIGEARKVMLDNKNDDGALWISHNYHRKLSRIAVQKTIQFYREKADISTSISPHAIRRATATHLLRAGATPLDIQTLLGHSSMEVLGHYLRVTIGDLKKMHEQTRLGQ